ncbi:S1 family peptidase [Alteraurantiacibacter buctensis]|uniref:Trypsin-like serine protease n=1 Tax=Alteraurantiacibacter buctensis TaxID=1503981 RepID=A0A844Z0A1_9SPHN|nr:serine protease [Alteraurantiacibacter buctensis]MXO72590.1 trypsin-like serine protease [Alteraurantiacibacter buctensis]
MKPFLRLVILLLALLGGPALADPGDIDAASRGVVRVIVVGGEGEEVYPVSHGSGFAVDAETIVTNAHVVSEAVNDPDLAIGLVPSSGGNAVYGRVIAVSPRNDLALVRTTHPMRLPPLTIAGNAPANSTAVLAIGYPMNVDQAQGLGEEDLFRAQPPVTSQGFLSGRRPSRDFDTLLHTAPIARGNSGGPLVDQCGRVVGVNSFGAESNATEAEFFFAVTMRELLPFLRANGITPQMNSLPCRSLDELEEAERQRAERQMLTAQREAQAAEQEAARQSDDLRAQVAFEVLDERAAGLFAAFILLLIAGAAGAYAAHAHRQQNLRHRALAGSVALMALAAALIAWFTRPAYADIQERVEERLREQMDSPQTGPLPQPASTAGNLTCTLDTGRSRIIGEPVAEFPLRWTEAGCVNGRTQYGATGGEWSRVFVPGDEDTVSVNRYDPQAREYVVERYLLDRTAMDELRSVRAEFQAPACNAGGTAATDLGDRQQAILTMLPDRPNERLVYTCSEDSAATGE